MDIFTIIFITLLTARVFGEVAYRMNQPPLIGELVAGIALGVITTKLALYYPSLKDINHNDVFVALTNLGIFFLMLLGGVEMKMSEIAKVSKKAFFVGTFGMIVPVISGYTLAYFFIPESDAKIAQCLFVGTALAITAVPVSVGILKQLNKLNTSAGKVIVSAAIFDDILSLFILAFLIGLIKTETAPDINQVFTLTGKIIFYFLITYTVVQYVVPFIIDLVGKLKTEEYELTSLILAGFAFCIIAENLGLHWILGAFTAGLLFEKDVTGGKPYHKVKHRLEAMSTGFFAPIFFASIGMELNLHAFIEIPFFVSLLVVTAFLTKILGAGIPAYLSGMSKLDALAIGVGMSARGAVELVIAGLALKAGLFTTPTPTPPEVKYLFSAIVMVALITTLATPLFLNLIYSHPHSEK